MEAAFVDAGSCDVDRRWKESGEGRGREAGGKNVEMVPLRLKWSRKDFYWLFIQNSVAHCFKLW